MFSKQLNNGVFIINAGLIRLTQIGFPKGKDKFLINKYESCRHILKNFHGSDGVAIKQNFLYLLKDLKKKIIVNCFFNDGTQKLYGTTPENWLAKGKPIKLSQFEKQFFLPFNNFEAVLDGTPEHDGCYERFASSQLELKDMMGVSNVR